MSITLLVYRHPEFKVDPNFLRAKCKVLCFPTTKYKHGSFDYEAPLFVDCLTSIGFVLGEISRKEGTRDLFGPLSRIGDMPKILHMERGWKPIALSPEELKAGDLIFLKKINSDRLVTHLSMAISSEEVFHSISLPEDGLEKGGGRIQVITDLFHRYTSFDRNSPLMRNSDSRRSIEWRKPPSLSLAATDTEYPNSDQSLFRIKDKEVPKPLQNGEIDFKPTLFFPTPMSDLDRTGHFRSRPIKIPTARSAFRSYEISPASSSPITITSSSLTSSTSDSSLNDRFSGSWPSSFSPPISHSTSIKISGNQSDSSPDSEDF